MSNKLQRVRGDELVGILGLPRAEKPKFLVRLSNVGNPDFRQDYRRPLPDTVCGWVAVETLGEASRYCREYMRFFDLGGGNWNGGEVETTEGVLVARVSANGRVWRVGKDGKADYEREVMI